VVIDRSHTPDFLLVSHDVRSLAVYPEPFPRCRNISVENSDFFRIHLYLTSPMSDKGDSIGISARHLTVELCGCEIDEMLSCFNSMHMCDGRTRQYREK